MAYYCKEGYDVKWKELEFEQLDILCQSLLVGKTLMTIYYILTYVTLHYIINVFLILINKSPFNIWYKKVSKAHLKKKHLVIKIFNQHSLSWDLKNLLKEAFRHTTWLYLLALEIFQHLPTNYNLEKQDF